MENKIRNHQLPTIIKEKIIEEIMQGMLKPGDKLVEARYSEMYGTSRGPVREAFYLLLSEGYVQKIPRKGTVVKGFTVEEVRNILEIRNFLEQLAVVQMNEEDRIACTQKMRNMIPKMQDALEKEDVEQLVRLNYEFHFQLIIGSRSEIIENMYSRMATQLISLQTMSISKKESNKKSLEEHIALTKHLSDRNLEGAKQLLDDHNRGLYPRVKDSFI